MRNDIQTLVDFDTWKRKQHLKRQQVERQFHLNVYLMTVVIILAALWAIGIWAGMRLAR